ncbi:MAG: hypothetical protein FD123_1748 [Bacteroidetes bacterium]|nr:MAG: hypothetical protein FD123_1748 [Bacteroidota bacterium]
MADDGFLPVLDSARTDGRKNGNFQVDVDIPVAAVFEVGQYFRILGVPFYPERLQGVERYNPGRRAGAEVFGQERSKRNVFPALYITRAPVVE